MDLSRSEILTKLRAAASKRAVPMPGQDTITGLYQVEIEITGPVSRRGVVSTETFWQVVANNLTRTTAETLVLLSKT